MTSNTTRNKITRKFSKLEKMTSADAVAIYLRDKGIKGQMQNSISCPVSNYSKQGVKVVYAGTTQTYTYVTITEKPYPEKNDTVEVFFGSDSVVKDFIKKFDNGEYPYLIEETVC